MDENGDLLIVNEEIQMVNGADLVRQTVEKVLGTNKGEWSLDIDEGIEFDNFLGKPKEDEIIKNEILDGLLQVDETFSIDQFAVEFDSESRKLKVSFTASNESGATVSTEVEY